MHADLILTGGRIVTLDEHDRVVSALAIAGDKVLAAGGAEVLAHATAATRVIDLRGCTAVPGLIDAHAHMDREGLKLVLPSLAGAKTIADVLAIIAALAAARKPGEWIVTMPLGEPPNFVGVPQCLCENRWPTRWELDQAAPDNPVYIRSIWGPWRHTLPLVSIANSRALALAGITRDTLSPSPLVEIQRDSAANEPTGVFIESTPYPIVEFTLMAAAPGFAVADRVAGIERSMAIYNALGTTSVFEGHGVASDVLAAYQAVRSEDRQTVRSTLTFSPAWSRAQGRAAGEVFASWGRWLAGRGYGDEWLRLMGIHAELGDSDENRLRASAQPQTGWSGFNYDSNLPRDALAELLLECARSGVMVVGLKPDMLEIFSAVDRQVPLAGRRWVLGHINRLTGEEVERIADLGLTVTTHTNRYVYKEGATTLASIGAQRESEIVPLRKLLDAGVRVCLASDNVPPSLFHPLWHAVARTTRDGTRVAYGQALTRLEALACATRNGAYLTFDESRKGTLEPGKFADVAVLTADPLSCAENEIRDLRAHMTIVGGRVVHAS
jgi:predicted amidohydrolase YtcJ